MARLVCLLFKSDYAQFFSLTEGNDYLGGDQSLEMVFKATEEDIWTPNKDSWFIHDLTPDKLTGWRE